LTAQARDRPQVTLRAAREEDSEMLMALRNDSDAVRFSVSGRAVSSEEHEHWFRVVRSDPSRCRIWIAEDGIEPVGQVRVDLNGNSGTVSITVAAEHRGRGIGTSMLKAVIAKAGTAGAPPRLNALVRSDNAASLHAFAAAGFRRVGEGSDFLELEWP
jgi:UDP-2,4-diacetamido-2,4,6-trideoxy-beta-L-altropyranose hydrolase